MTVNVRRGILKINGEAIKQVEKKRLGINCSGCSAGGIMERDTKE